MNSYFKQMRAALAMGGLVVAVAMVVKQTAVGANAPVPAPAPDAVEDAQNPRPMPGNRPEQKKNAHDQSGIFDAEKAPPSSTAFQAQPDQGEMRGFDFARDPLNAKTPNESPDAITKADMAAKEGVMAKQRELLASRYDLTPHFDPEIKMTVESRLRWDQPRDCAMG